MIATLDLAVIFDVNHFLILGKFIAGQEVIHARTPVILSGNSTSIRPMTVNEHSQRIKLPKSVTHVTIIQYLLERLPLALCSARPAAL